MTPQELRQKYIDFFVKKHGHKEIPSASLIPENDPTVLFTTAGMHPLVPYLMGEKHPLGKRLTDVQKCVRTDDIDEVGDTSHLTFFEMLGNWSLGDYFKEEAIKMSYEFLTEELKLDPKRLMVSCFTGDKDAPRDDEAAQIWESLGFKRAENEKERGGKKLIYFYDKKENWWGPAGQTGPCGPDTEMFYEVDPKKEQCPNCFKNGPACLCSKYVEIWNDVFMQYFKKEDSSFEPLTQKNVDTGMGFERTLAVLNKRESCFETELFEKAIEKIREFAKNSTHLEVAREERIIADHLRTATFILGDQKGVTPSNTDQGYILRRLIRRAIRSGKKLGITEKFTQEVAKIYIALYHQRYPELMKNEKKILDELNKEEEKFSKTLDKGEREFAKMIARLTDKKELSGENAFHLYDTYGFPLEMTRELAAENGLTIDEEGFKKAFEGHQSSSRAGATQKFSGGLADHSEAVTKYHTATHLLLEALRRVLGNHVYQKGSNLTSERLRLDFSNPEKLTKEQIEKVEKIVNEQIARNLEVTCEEMTVEEAKAAGAMGVFEERYGEKVKVYTIGDFSKEICGGPHVTNTGVLGKFKIQKEESSSSGVRRIKAVLE